MDEYPNQMNSVHDVKIALCYILEKLNKAVTEQQLYEIAVNSEVINYFNYTEALESLLENNSVSKQLIDDEYCIVLEEKGKLGSEYFIDYIPFFFRKRILRAAYAFFAKLKRESESDISIKETSNGFEVDCAIKDSEYDLMRISLYAPDYDQAEIIKNKILLNPAAFYNGVVTAALNNEEEQIYVDIRD